MSKMHALFAPLMALSLAACASEPYAQQMQQRQQAYNAAAGAPVRSFHFVNSEQLYSWEALSESQLVVYTLPNRAYLLDVGPCNNLVVTTRITLTNFADSVQTGFDKVLAGPPYIPCIIKQIRPVDLAQFKLDRQAQRQANSVPRGSNAPPAAAPGGG